MPWKYQNGCKKLDMMILMERWNDVVIRWFEVRIIANKHGEWYFLVQRL